MRLAELKLATVELERAKTLQKRDFISASTVDQRQAERDVAAAAVTAARASVGDTEAAQEAAEAKAKAAERRNRAIMQGYTGNMCTECQNFTMVRNGTCEKCDTCGATSGCS